MTGSVTHRWLAPGCLRLATNGRATLTTAMRVVYRIHHRATDMWASPQQARTSSLANGDILMIEVAYLADGGNPTDMYEALLTRRQAHLGIIALFRHQLGGTACATDELTAAPWMQFQIMDHR